MRILSFSLGISLMSAALGVAPATAQNATPAAAPVTADLVAPADPLPGLPIVASGGVWSVIQPRMSAGYTTGPGFGYQNGYTTLDGFWPILGSNTNNLVFVDTRALLSDNHSLWGNNLELGYRHFNPETNRILGAWSSWDLRNSPVATYQQIAGGLESFGRYLDAHANFYAVAGPSYHQTGTFMLAPIFQGHNVVLPTVVNYESALSGTDLEVGGRLPFLGQFGVRGYAGGYAFHANSFGDVGGFQARLMARVNNNLDFNLQVRNDKAFGTTVSFGGALRWGGVRRQYREPERDSVYNRMADPTERNVNIAVLDKSKEYNQLAINPATGLPLSIVYVNNTAPAGGDGTFLHPLNMLAGAPGLAGINGYIALEPGNLTTAGQNAGITLLNGQHLLGTGVPNQLFTQQGTFTLPSIGSGTPVITAPGNGITLANNNEVANLAIVGTNNGIFGMGIRGFNIHGVTITGAGTGINLINPSGTGLISGNTITNSVNDGVDVISSIPVALNLTVANNNLSNNGVFGLFTSLTDTTKTTPLNVTLTGNTASNNSIDGLEVFMASGSSQTITANNNNTVNNSIFLGQSNSGGSQTMTANGNSVIGSNGTGVFAGQLNAGTSQTVTLIGNTATSNVGAGIQSFQIASGTTQSTTIHGNTVNSNLFGIDVSQTASSAFSQSIVGNTARNNTINGLRIAVAGVGSSTVSNNTTSGNPRGIAFAENFGTATVTLSQNSATDTLGYRFFNNAGTPLIVNFFSNGGGNNTYNGGAIIFPGAPPAVTTVGTVTIN